MKLALVDVETTGGKPIEDRIIDIGIVLVDDFKIVKEWQSLVNPECPISTFITGITGISDIHVSSAPTFKSIHEEIYELLQDRVFVAHNARFDYSFVKHEFYRQNKRFQAPQLCTVKLSHQLYPQHKRHNLDEIISRFNISIDHRHRALPDAKTIFYFFESCIKEKTLDTVTEVINKITHTPALPTHIPQEKILKLPSSAGVYIFYDHDGNPLYVGKSVNIRDRVMSHFYDDLNSDKEMAIKQQITHIDYVSCAGELEALILESRMVKELQPAFNKKLRKTDEYVVAKLVQNAHGYLTIATDKQNQLTYEDKDQIVLVAKSKRKLNSQIKSLIEVFQLCPKLCAQESGKGACFSYHLDTCLGACVQKEDHEIYNQRVRQAFSTAPIPTWPYPEPIIVHEYNSTLDITAYHLIEHWSIKRTVRSLDDVWVSAVDEHPISLDELSIIKSYILRPSNKIIPLSKVITVEH